MPKARGAPRRGFGGPWISRNALLAGGFFLLSLALLYLTARLVSPFIGALIWAAVITILVYPLYTLALKLTGHRRTVASALVTTIITLGGLVSSVALLTVLVKESRAAYVGLVEFLRSGGYKAIVSRIASLPGELMPGGLDQAMMDQIELWCKNTAAGTLNTIADGLKGMLNTWIGNLPGLAINLMIVFVSLFYFLRDGELWLRKLKEVLPLAPRVRDVVIKQFTMTIRAVMHGMLFTAAVQATLLALGFWFFGVPNPVFAGMVAFFLSLVPLVGPALLWAPVSVWYFYQGDNAMGIKVFLYGLVVVSTIDTFLRPYIIGEQARLPVLLLIISILGGLMTFGPLGLFLGPVLVAVGLAMAGIYREITSGKRAV